MIVQRCEFAGKPVKMIIHNVLLQKSQIKHRSHFRDPLGPEILANVLLVTDESVQ